MAAPHFQTILWICWALGPCSPEQCQVQYHTDSWGITYTSSFKNVKITYIVICLEFILQRIQIQLTCFGSILLLLCFICNRDLKPNFQKQFFLTLYRCDIMYVKILCNFEISKLLIFHTCPKQVCCFVTF